VKPDTGNELVDAILHAAHRVRTATDANLREAGLSLPGFKLLKALSVADRSMREVSDVLHVSPRTVTDIIDGLQARELVVRQAHPTDRRVTLLHLTSQGARRLAEATIGADRARDAAIKGLDTDEQQTLTRLLGRVAAEGLKVS
jgi:DNA-binding MarR family transcriptional regulator